MKPTSAASGSTERGRYGMQLTEAPVFLLGLVLFFLDELKLRQMLGNVAALAAGVRLHQRMFLLAVVTQSPRSSLTCSTS